MQEVHTSFNWLLSIIESSTTQFHQLCVDKLIMQFWLMYADKDLVVELEQKSKNHFQKLNITPITNH